MSNDEIISMYVMDKKSICDISKVCDRSKSAIRLILHKAGVLRSVSEGVRLAAPKISEARRGTHWNVTEEGRENMRIAAIKRWEGRSRGISLKPNGYYEITVGRNKGRPLHDIIMEIYIGRRLKKGEVVHHKNGIRTDNEITNLELLTRSEHSRLHTLKNIANGKNYDISREAKRGEDHNKAKLSEEDVLLILTDKRIYKEIALQYNVSLSCIKHIKRHRNWKFLTETK